MIEFGPIARIREGDEGRFWLWFEPNYGSIFVDYDTGIIDSGGSTLDHKLQQGRAWRFKDSDN